MRKTMTGSTLTLSSVAANTAHVESSSDELSAAAALLGVVGPSSSVSHGFRLESEIASAAPNLSFKASTYAGLESLADEANARAASSSSPSTNRPRVVSNETEEGPTVQKSNSGGLDALAALASEAHSANTSFGEKELMHDQKQLAPHVAANGIASPSSSSDDESMPPPPPRRQRSCSNPEGMEKWDSLSLDRSTRRHFVLPTSILEEELAEASAAIQQKQLMRTAIPEEPDEDEFDDDNVSPSPDTVVDHPDNEEEELIEEEEEIDESKLTPDELLKRARSRLLEDLSEGNINGDKGELTLPHSLGKYKEVYNRNGRIGIYTPAERAAIIARFNRKRQRRVWNKKIRYNCRKSLADRRLRVKGRFVKRSEQEQLAKEIQARAEQQAEESPASNDGDDDAEMPDVNDPEAGFVPTEDQPFRRLRRHTIT